MTTSNIINKRLKRKQDAERIKEENRKRREEDDIHKRVKYFREKAGLEQRELAALAGCCDEYISMIENKRVDPGHSYMKKIIKALEVSYAVFYESDITQKPDVALKTTDESSTKNQ